MERAVVTILILIAVVAVLGVLIRTSPEIMDFMSSFAIQNQGNNQELNQIDNNPSPQTQSSSPQSSPLTGQAISDPNETAQSKWFSSTITYSFENEKACAPHENIRIRKAFEIIQQESSNAISFQEVNGSSQISISCSPNFSSSDTQKEGKFAAAETTTNTLGNNIQSASIVFYHINQNTIASNCGSFPDTEVHEILHALGFRHTNERFHIMNPTQLYCPTKINSDVIVKLRDIYS